MFDITATHPFQLRCWIQVHLQPSLSPLFLKTVLKLLKMLQPHFSTVLPPQPSSLPSLSTPLASLLTTKTSRIQQVTIIRDFHPHHLPVDDQQLSKWTTKTSSRRAIPLQTGIPSVCQKNGNFSSELQNTILPSKNEIRIKSPLPSIREMSCHQHRLLFSCTCKV